MKITRQMVIGVLMASAALVALLLTPAAKTADKNPSFNLETDIPSEFGDWQVNSSIVPVIPSPDVKENLDRIYDQIVNRTYINSRGQMMMLTIAYGSVQNAKLRTHRQEVCYRAQGFTVENVTSKSLSILNRPVAATQMFAFQGRRQEPVTYWFTMGDQVVQSYFDRQLVQLKYALTGYVPDGFLVRVSSFSTDTNSAFQAQEGFANELFTSIKQSLANRLIGGEP